MRQFTDQPRDEICGIGPGYGLTGLLWLAGADRETEPPSSAAVDAFAAGADIQVVAS